MLGGGQGIGLAFAEELARRGLAVLLVDVRDDLLESAGDRVRAANANIEVGTSTSPRPISQRGSPR